MSIRNNYRRQYHLLQVTSSANQSTQSFAWLSPPYTWQTKRWNDKENSTNEATNSKFEMRNKRGIKIKFLLRHTWKFSSKALISLSILYQSTRITWKSLPRHLVPLDISSKALGSLGILCQGTRITWKSPPRHSVPSKISSKALGSLDILF